MRETTGRARATTKLHSLNGLAGGIESGRERRATLRKALGYWADNDEAPESTLSKAVRQQKKREMSRKIAGSTEVAFETEGARERTGSVQTL